MVGVETRLLMVWMGVSRPIPDDRLPDVAIYNKELEQLGNPTWLNVSWLYCECYLFR
jgi:hypothetical protein